MEEETKWANVFTGRACRSCGGTKRYEKSRRCVSCERAKARRNKNRKPKVHNGNYRRNWPSFMRNGVRVYVDAIVHLRLGNEGRYENI